MSGGKNGATPFQNLAHLQSKPLYAEPAELESSKCPSHPTKRAWTDPMEAVREAEARTVAAKMEIVAYRCDSCGNAHLCKAAAVRPGSLLSRPESERVLPLVLGNAEAKRKALREYLVSHPTPTTDELCVFLDLSRGAIGKYMGEVGYHNTRGAKAKWVLNKQAAAAPANFEVFKGRRGGLKAVDKPVESKPLEAAKRRHPSALDAGWRMMTNVDPIRHMPLGDLLDTFRAAGMEVRIQVRELQ